MENLWTYQLCRWPWPCTEWICEGQTHLKAKCKSCIFYIFWKHGIHEMVWHQKIIGMVKERNIFKRQQKSGTWSTVNKLQLCPVFSSLMFHFFFKKLKVVFLFLIFAPFPRAPALNILSFFSSNTHYFFFIPF